MPSFARTVRNPSCGSTSNPLTRNANASVFVLMVPDLVATAALFSPSRITDALAKPILS